MRRLAWRVCGVIWGMAFLLTMGVRYTGVIFPHEIVTFYTRAQNEPFLDIYAFDLQTRVLVNLTQHRANDSEFAWSPDGTQLAFVSTRGGEGVRGVFVADARFTTVRAVGLEQVLAPPVWSPDGRFLAVSVLTTGSVLPDIYRVEVATLASENITRTPYEGEHSVAWSPDGAWLSYIAFTYPFVYGLRPDGTERRLFTSVASDGAVWAADSQSIAFVALREQTVLRQSVQDATLHQLALQRPISELAWSPAGTHLAFWTTTADQRALLVLSATGAAEIRWIVPLNEVSTPLWTHDEQAVVFLATEERGGQRQRGLYRLTLADGQLELLWTMGQMQGAAWRPQ